ncbi:protein of unknown function [Paraburkholderia kururiensis]
MQEKCEGMAVQFGNDRRAGSGAKRTTCGAIAPPAVQGRAKRRAAAIRLELIWGQLVLSAAVWGRAAWAPRPGQLRRPLPPSLLPHDAA